MSKTYTQLRDDTEPLNELRVLRTGAALLYASKVKTEGDKTVARIKDAQAQLNKVAGAKTTEEKLDIIADGIGSMGDAIIAQRLMLGNMTGIVLFAALLAERTDKQMIKLLKGKSRR